MGYSFFQFSLQRNVIVLALIDLITEILGTAFSIVLLISVIRKVKRINNPDSHLNEDEDSKDALYYEGNYCIYKLFSIYLDSQKVKMTS